MKCLTCVAALVLVALNVPGGVVPTRLPAQAVVSARQPHAAGNGCDLDEEAIGELAALGGPPLTDASFVGT